VELHVRKKDSEISFTGSVDELYALAGTELVARTLPINEDLPRPPILAYPGTQKLLPGDVYPGYEQPVQPVHIPSPAPIQTVQVPNVDLINELDRLRKERDDALAIARQVETERVTPPHNPSQVNQNDPALAVTQPVKGGELIVKPKRWWVLPANVVGGVFLAAFFWWLISGMTVVDTGRTFFQMINKPSVKPSPTVSPSPAASPKAQPSAPVPEQGSVNLQLNVGT
jgi:hypothetical protein